MKRSAVLGLTIAALAAWGCVPESGGGDDDPIVIDPGQDPEPDPGMEPDPDPGMEPEPDPDPEPGMEPEPDPDPDPQRDGLAVLGYQGHGPGSVDITVIATDRDGLAVPRDLDFNHDAETPELWIVNRWDDSTTTIFEPGTPQQESIHLIDPFALHFMEEVSSIAFGAPGTFGTCQESRNTYNGQAERNDFMGPSLWPSDLNIYARTNPDAVAFLGFDLGSHLDMQHESPLCMGMAWDKANVYWIFEGLTNSIARNDFGEDHGPGFDDHSDGIVTRFGVGEVSRVPDVPSHLVFDQDTGLLYIADTGNARVAVLDTFSGELGPPMPVVEPGTVLRMATDYEPIATVFQNPELQLPSGLAKQGDVLFVGDNANGRIWGISASTGEVLDYLDTGIEEGGLMGLEIGPEGNLWVVDAWTHRVLRISPLAD